MAADITVADSNTDFVLDIQPKDRFKLTDDFISGYKRIKPKWGPLGEITYRRTYSRIKEDGKYEDWYETIRRVVEGCYTYQRWHCRRFGLPWNAKKAQKSAQTMYELIFDMKFLPPGRGLWMAGTEYVEKRGSACLNNCSFRSTEDIDIDFAEPFCFLMDYSFLGIGVGGDCRGAGKVGIKEPRESDDVHVVEDSREGWVKLVRRILNAYVQRDTVPIQIDYSLVRKAGDPIKGFGGTSSGPESLMELIDSLHKVLKPLIGKKITSSAIVDVFNLIGRCVVAGGVRRTAEVMFGDAMDGDFLRLKDPTLNLEALQSHRWASNNSVFAKVGQDYTQIAEFIARNGEPGIMWLDTAQKFSRMIDPIDNKDRAIMGANPCLEQSLESTEICNLVEVFPARLESFDEFKLALKFAYLYAKSITLVPTHNLRTNAVMLRNRRIGTSCSGITQAFTKHGRREFLNWCDTGYKYLEHLDDEYSRWLCIPKSIKKTSVKPSGTISLLNGSSPGIHYPIAEYYWRVIRFASDSPLVKVLKKSGHKCVEIDPKKEPNTTAVYFPIKEAFFDRAEDDVTMWEQLENAAALQAYWCDNQVSVTIKFKPEEAKDIKKALELYETRLKAISFLPITNHGYEHAPYQKITKEEYEAAAKKLKPVDYSASLHEKEDKFCDGDKCEIPPRGM